MKGVVAVAVLFAIGMTFVAVQLTAAPKPPEPVCMDDETQEQARTIMLAAIDQGLKQHTTFVFQNWLKDPTDQPRRAVAGLHIGISAYVRSRKALDAWNPPECPEGAK